MKQYSKGLVWALLGVALLYYGGEQLKTEPRRVPATAVDFHGVVRDQLGGPVREALISYSIYHAPAGQTLKGPGARATRGMAKTRTDGTFTVTGNGGYLYINQVYKPEYLFEPVLDAFVYESSKYCYDGSPYCRAHSIHQPDESRPVVINAWNIIETAPLEIGKETYTYLMNGESYRVPMEGIESDLRATFVQLSRDSENRLDKSWQVTFSIPEGGIIDSEDYFMFMAPEDGYAPEISFSSHDEKWLEKTFYVRADDEKAHARIKLKFAGYYGRNEKGFITYNYAVNTDSSRLLLPEVGPYFKQWER